MSYLPPVSLSCCCRLSQRYHHDEKIIGDCLPNGILVIRLPKYGSCNWTGANCNMQGDGVRLHPSRQGNIEDFLLETEPEIEGLIKTLGASPNDAAIAPSAYMQLVELFNKKALTWVPSKNIIGVSRVVGANLSQKEVFDSLFGTQQIPVLGMNKNGHFGHVLHFCELTYERDRLQRVKIGGLQPEFALYQIVSQKIKIPHHCQVLSPSLSGEVTSKQKEFDSKFGAVRKTVILLNKYNFHMEKEEFFLAAPSRWSNLRAKVVLAKQRIAPKMQLRSEQISRSSPSYAIREEFAACEAFLRTCSYERAHTLLKSFKSRVCELEVESRNLVELQDLLEACIVDFTCISEFRGDIETLEKVWVTSKGMKAHHTLWRSGKWSSLSSNLPSIAHETECQLLELKSLPKNAHSWDVYIGLIEGITQIKACIPLIKSFSNKAMRSRHWKLLVRTLGAQQSTTPDKLQESSLNELLDLGLLNFTDDLLAICTRAETDVQMEFSLQNCEEVWLSKVFDMKSVIRKRLSGESESARVDLVKTTRESSIVLSGSKMVGIDVYLDCRPLLKINFNFGVGNEQKWSFWACSSLLRAYL
eukprot:sb/3463305/